MAPPTRFVVGVGVNPAAEFLDREIRRFAAKVEAGADFAISQPVFDLDQLDQFLRATEGFGIPILAGIWPLVSLRNAEFLANEVPGVSIPAATLARMQVASERGRDAALAEGVAIARELHRGRRAARGRGAGGGPARAGPRGAGDARALSPRWLTGGPAPSALRPRPPGRR